MKRLRIVALAILLVVASVFADAVIIEFSGEPSQDKVFLTWKTGEEQNVDLFMIEKSTNKTDFNKIGEVAPRGSNSTYEFIDSDVTETKSIYYYRLRIRNSDGTFQLSEPITVILKVSSFAKTWGSIKALFQ